MALGRLGAPGEMQTTIPDRLMHAGIVCNLKP